MASKLSLAGLFGKIKAKPWAVYVICGLCALALLLIFGMFDNKQGSTLDTNGKVSSTENYLLSLETRLNDVLSAIEGAGDVKCMITLNGEVERVVAYSNDEKKSSSSNTTSSGATNSSNTSTVSKEPILITVNGKTEPLVLYEIMPSIKGIVIVASGADNIKVKLSLLKAVQALLNVESSQVEIFTKQNYKGE